MEERDKLADFDSVSVAEARRTFAAVVDRASRDQDRIVLTRRGKPVAVLVPPEDVELLLDLEDAVDEKAVQEWLESGGETEETVSLEELKKELGWT